MREAPKRILNINFKYFNINAAPLSIRLIATYTMTISSVYLLSINVTCCNYAGNFIVLYLMTIDIVRDEVNVLNGHLDSIYITRTLVWAFFHLLLFFIQF